MDMPEPVRDGTERALRSSEARTGSTGTSGRTSRLRTLLAFLAWSLIFALAYAQSPLYTSNQNQYFLHGAAQAGVGALDQDWLAGTADPTPVFTELVRLTLEILPPEAFYLEYALLMGVYLFSLRGIVETLVPTASPWARRLTFTAGLIAVHSAAFRFALGRLPGPYWGHLFEAGVAGQRLLGPVFQPSVFGVFLILSVFLHLRGRHVGSIVSAAVAATFHPTYLLSAGALTLAYMWNARRETGTIGRPLALGILASALVLPVAAHAVSTFEPTSARLSELAVRVLVEERIPHHALLAEWLDVTVLVKAALVAAALFASRRTRLFPVLGLPAFIALLLTVAQVATGSYRLALLFPWRPSTLLVPIASALLLGLALVRGLERFPQVETRPRRLAAAALALVAAVAGAGVVSFAYDLDQKTGDEAAPVLAYVARTHADGIVYVIPPKLQDFRLATGAPAFVDFKSIPYRDAELLEWEERLRLAEFFYRDRVEDIDCSLLDRIEAMDAVGRVVLGPEQMGLECPRLHELFRDGAYGVYALR